MSRLDTLRPGLLGLGLVALAAQCYGLYSPGDPEPSLQVPGLDKVVHVLMFAVPVWLFLRAGAPRLLVLGLAVAQTAFSEYAQARWVPFRSGDPWDALADLAGVGLGVWLAARTPRRITAPAAADRTPPRGG